jgi:hypothetical protein
VARERKNRLDKHFKPVLRTILQFSVLSARQFLSITNIMFVIAGIYFIVVAGLGEGSAYSAIGALFCFVAVVLMVWKDLMVTAPWRTAAAAFSLVLFLGQLVANATSTSTASAYSITSTVVNGALFVLFLGVLLSASRDMMRKSTSEEEDEKEDKKEAKRLTYQV